MGVSVHNNCPANREGNCAFSNFEKYCNCQYGIENCFKLRGGHDPQIREYKAHGKTIRIMIHVSDEDWEWEGTKFKNGLKRDRMEEKYGTF